MIAGLSEPTPTSFLKPGNPLPSAVSTPVHIANLSAALSRHPNPTLVQYVINGLTHGFLIGYSGPHINLVPKNLLSATAHQDSVSSALCTELSRGHTSGPFTTPPFTSLHCSPLGSAEKKDGSRRLIMDLSQPTGASINDGIQKEEFPIKYTLFDVATNMVYRRGRSCLMAKIDIKHAFRLLPVHPSQWNLLGMFWLGYYFVDTVLPFGLRSSPAIFNSFADLVCWVLENNYQLFIMHYSDDFFLVCAASLPQATTDMNTAISAFDHFNIPIALDKLEGPSTVITFLGIEIDSTSFTMRLPDDKFTEILDLLKVWAVRKKCTKKELLSLIGKLSFACKVVRPGRFFLRRLINLSTTVSKLHHHISLNKDTQADISWWLTWFPSWNQSSIIPQDTVTTSDSLQLFTDASRLGLGAVYGNEWIQASWPAEFVTHSIDFLELFAIVAACCTWGHGWAGKKILFHCDNLPIVQAWDKKSSSSPLIMSLLRKLFFIAVKWDFSVAFSHIPGHFNIAADAISRFQLQRFFNYQPSANKVPSGIPSTTWEMTEDP